MLGTIKFFPGLPPAKCTHQRASGPCVLGPGLPNQLMDHGPNPVEEFHLLGVTMGQAQQSRSIESNVLGEYPARATDLFEVPFRRPGQRGRPPYPPVTLGDVWVLNGVPEDVERKVQMCEGSKAPLRDLDSEQAGGRESAGATKAGQLSVDCSARTIHRQLVQRLG